MSVVQPLLQLAKDTAAAEKDVQIVLALWMFHFKGVFEWTTRKKSRHNSIDNRNLNFTRSNAISSLRTLKRTITAN